MARGWTRPIVALVAMSLAGGCSGARVERAEPASLARPATPAAPDVAAPVVPAPSPAASFVAPPTTVAPTTTTTAPRVRKAVATGYRPFAAVGPVVLTHPAATVERVGFHESNHDGAQGLAATATTAAPTILEARERGTNPTSAADVVVDPAAEIRSPVTGRVKRAGTYVLYCRHSDDYLVIEPDDRPGWEVKLLHISGVQVRAGDRVVSGETVVAPRATQLPFESQVDELRTADPAWPHVHLEVVDIAVKDRPSPGGGCP